MIRVFTFIIIILVIYGFHKYYKKKEHFGSDSVLNELNRIFTDVKFGSNNRFDDTVHEYGSHTKKVSKTFPGCNDGFELKKNIDFFNWWECGKTCKGSEYWTDGSCNCLCEPISKEKLKLNDAFLSSLEYWNKL